jgi:hypothetical protein
MKTNIHFWSRSVVVRMKNVSDKSCRENQNTHLCSVTYFWKSCHLWDGQATHYSMVHVHCMLDTKVYKHTYWICNTYCFSTATLVARTHLSITLHIHCLSFFFFLFFSFFLSFFFLPFFLSSFLFFYKSPVLYLFTNPFFYSCFTSALCFWSFIF